MLARLTICGITLGSAAALIASGPVPGLIVCAIVAAVVWFERNPVPYHRSPRRRGSA